MAKMTRNDLKGLVKECLFEILLEATETDGNEQITESRKPRKKKASSRRPALDNIRMNDSEPAKKQPLDVSGLTSDPVMAAIFQDTAATTLVEQARAESGKPTQGRAVDAAALAVANNSPEDLFGSASQNWAALAFGDK